MTIAARRTELAGLITTALVEATDLVPKSVTIDPYQAGAGDAPWSGWLELESSDTQETTFGEVRCTFLVVLPVAAHRSDFEPVQDALTWPIMAAILAAGGRGVTVTPSTEIQGNTALYALNARFVTESEVA